MTINLNPYSTKELNALHKDIDKELRARRKQDEKKAREEMKKVAERYGLTLNEVVGGTVTKPKGRAKVAGKYVHPDDPSKTWTGRGRKPAWIKEWESAGRHAGQTESIVEVSEVWGRDAIDVCPHHHWRKAKASCGHMTTASSGRADVYRYDH